MYVNRKRKKNQQLTKRLRVFYVLSRDAAKPAFNGSAGGEPLTADNPLLGSGLLNTLPVFGNGALAKLTYATVRSRYSVALGSPPLVVKGPTNELTP